MNQPLDDHRTGTWLAQAVDALATPMLWLRPDGSLLHANAAATALLRRGRPLRRAGGRIEATEPSAGAAFATALLDASRAPGGTASVLTPTMLGCLGTLVSLRRGATAAETAILVLMLAAETARDVRPFASSHGLSPEHTHVLDCLARGMSQVQAAERLSLTPGEMRSRVAALKRKTGHPSLPALLADLARLPALAPADR